jgi:hypothetical protein
LKGTSFSPYELKGTGFTGCGKTLHGTHEVSGRDFSRADKGFPINLRLQPLGEFFHLKSTFPATFGVFPQP